MDEVLMRFGVVGFCADCSGDRLLVPADDDGYDLCCTDCDAAVSTIHLSAPLRDGGLSARRAG
jgi:hypothetical protein